jgi:hypothetical protein
MMWWSESTVMVHGCTDPSFDESHRSVDLRPELEDLRGMFKF